MDMEFVKVKNLILLVEVNTMATREYVAMIKRKIFHVKERVQDTTSG